MRLSEILFEGLEQGMSLNQLYDGNTPDEHELIWQYVGLDDFDVPFKVIDINPVEIWKSWKPDGEQTMEEVYQAHATKAQKGYIDKIRKQVKAGRRFDPVVVYDNELVDGNHRIAAMALEGVTSAKALDLGEEVE